ncbi:nSTAND1 domain-containing NTPase [Monashia sp. NPDC004114]
MWCGALGPLVVKRADGSIVSVGGWARRLLFGALLSRAGRTVSPDVLIDDVWGIAPPRSAAKTLQSHVVRLRHDLGRDESDAILVTERTGYRLVLGPDDFDVTQFEMRVSDALVAQAAADLERALAGLDEALVLWRGEAYEEFADAPFSVGERLRLFELRADAQEHRTDIAFALGQSSELVSDLEKRLAAAPYRERGWEQLIVALYRAGRQADALGAYRRASTVLAEDLGIDPGPGLRELEMRILRQDLDLLGPLPPRAPVLLAPKRDVCPYRGLASYTDADSELFVGRERLTAELVGRLADSHLVVVVGASGTGKSSALRAGLVAALRAGALPGSASWRSAVVTPVDDLAAVLTAELDLVVLDQAEELFTRLSVLERRVAVDRLEQFVAVGGRAVLALRGDFYGRLAELQRLARHAQAGTVLVGPLREDELRRVVIEPARRVGLQVEEALVDRVLDDVAGQPAALPMLSAALVRTWENRAGDALTLEGYQRGGGVASAVEATAEEVYLHLDETERTHARRLLVRLAGREGDTWIRRPMRRGDVPPDADTASVLTALAAARLVTITEARVEITHDALLAHWPRLRGWLEERVLAAALLDHLDVASRAWHNAARPSTDLYRGARLQAALEWRVGHPDDVSSAEGEFLDASEAAADAELTAVRDQVKREARGRRRLRAVAVGLAAMVALAAVGVGVALHERASADESAASALSAALTADSRRLAALSLTAPDIATSSLLAAASYRLQDSTDSRGALLSAVERNESALWRIQIDHRPQAVVATPDGTRVAVLDNRRHVHIIETATRHQVAEFSLHAFLMSGLTPDGRQIITYGPDRNEDDNGRLSIVDVATGRRVRVLTTAGALDPALSADGRWLVQVTSHKVSGGVVVDVFDARDWTARPRQFAVPQGAEVVAAGRSSLAVGGADGSVEVRRWVDLRPIAHVPATLPPGADSEPLFAMSPDGSHVAVQDRSDGRRIDIVRVSGAGPARTTLPTQAQDVGIFGFSPDGAELAVTGLGGAVAVYRTTDGAQVESLAGHSGPSYGLAWTGTTTPTGLYTVGLDSNLVSWSISSIPRLVTESGPDISTPDRGETFGHFVLGMTPQEGSVPESKLNLYRADLSSGTWEQWSPNLPDSEYINQFVGSADGTIGLLSVGDGTQHNLIQIWDLVRHARVGELDLPRQTGIPLDLMAAIAPDGRTAYCTLDATQIGVFALPSGKYLRSFDVHFAPPDGDRILADPWRFDPAGRLLVGGIDTGPHAQNGPDALGPNDTRPPNQRLLLLDPRTGQTLSQISMGDNRGPTVSEWSPDGRYLAVGTYDGTLTLYDAASLSVVASPGPVEPGSLRTAMFAPDGRTLVTSGSSGSISFWDVPSLHRVAAPFSVSVADASSGVLAFYAPDSDVVGFAADVSKPTTDLQRWFNLRATPDDLIRTACALAGADITQAEWQRDVGDRPYQHVCT